MEIQLWNGCEIPRLDNWLTDDGEVLMRRLSFTSLLVHISVRGWADPRAIVWLEWFDRLKRPIIRVYGIKTATFGSMTFKLVKRHNWRALSSGIQRHVVRRSQRTSRRNKSPSSSELKSKSNKMPDKQRTELWVHDTLAECANARANLT
jgi:hypothetical protein